MRCSNCGGEITGGKKFCGHCGLRVQALPEFDEDAPTRIDVHSPAMVPHPAPSEGGRTEPAMASRQSLSASLSPRESSLQNKEISREYLALSGISFKPEASSSSKPEEPKKYSWLGCGLLFLAFLAGLWLLWAIQLL